jgi:hypothetical protein
LEVRSLGEDEDGGCGHHIDGGGGGGVESAWGVRASTTAAWRRRLRTTAMARVGDLERRSAEAEGTDGVVEPTRMVRRCP